MSLLNRRSRHRISCSRDTLHSTMSLLNLSRRVKWIWKQITFTFHNVSIKSPIIQTFCKRLTNSLHSTMSLLNLLRNRLFYNMSSSLHSTMSLLNLTDSYCLFATPIFIFLNVSIKSAAGLYWNYFFHTLYIPQCLY